MQKISNCFSGVAERVGVINKLPLLLLFRIYASLEIAEYWVIDVVGKRIFAFQLQESKQYKECRISQSLLGLPILLLEQALARLPKESKPFGYNG